MVYDPFSRGPYPVGVCTVDVRDRVRDRALPTEIWYPAIAAHQGQDLDPDLRDRYTLLPGAPPAYQLAVRDAPARIGGFPLLLFSHGFGGHRRQSTFFCTHVASHGFVVAACDHTGDTAADLLTRATLSADEQKERGRAIVRMRPEDMTCVLDQLLAGVASPATLGLDARVTGSSPVASQPPGAGGLARVAIAGHSFGGFTALATASRDSRIAVVIGLAPAGGPSPAGGALARRLDLDWRRVIPTLFLAGTEDSVLPLDGIQTLYDRLVAPKRLVAIADADHFHFCDGARQLHELFRSLPSPIPLARPFPAFASLCPQKAAYDVIRGVGLAHLDAHLRHSAEARDFLATDLVDRAQARGATIELR